MLRFAHMNANATHEMCFSGYDWLGHAREQLANQMRERGAADASVAPPSTQSERRGVQRARRPRVRPARCDDLLLFLPC